MKINNPAAAAGGVTGVTGPSSSTDNAIARFDSTTGKLIQNSGVTIDDSDNLSGVNNVTGADANFVTGTAGTNGNLAQWNTDGDAVDSSIPASTVLVDGDVGSVVQAYDAGLTAIAGLTPASSLIVGDGLGSWETVTQANFITNNSIAKTSNKLSAFAATTSAELAGVISDETGSGALVFGTSPTLTTPALGTPSALVLTNATGLTTSGIAAATLVIESEGIASNDNDTTLPTSAAVKDYADNATATLTNKTIGASTLSGTMSAADNIIDQPKIQDYSETVNAIGSIGGGTQDIDLEDGNVVTATVDTSETTFTFSNPPASGSAGSFTLILTNGGSQTVNWPASVDWAGATAPTLTSSGVDILTFTTVDAGTTWNGFAAGINMS